MKRGLLQDQAKGEREPERILHEQHVRRRMPAGGPGAISRASQPEGAIRNARPTASARCGTASSGTMPRLMRVSAAVPWPATNTSRVASATAVEAKPVVSVTCTAAARPGAASRRRQGSSENCSPPSTGR